MGTIVLECANLPILPTIKFQTRIKARQKKEIEQQQYGSPPGRDTLLLTSTGCLIVESIRNHKLRGCDKIQPLLFRGIRLSA